MLSIEVVTGVPKMAIGGFAIVTAPTVAELHAVLGAPSRIDDGERPAPVGHRNNQIHVYDTIGLTFIEHHYTRRAQAISCYFETEEPQFRFTPRQPFAGQLVFDSIGMPLGSEERTFLSASPIEFAHWLGGSWSYQFDGFAVHVETRGPKRPSGRRGRVRKVIEVSLSWPHDDWGTPSGTLEPLYVDYTTI